MEKIRLAVIGVGDRSLWIIKSFLSKYEDVEICILCDPYEDRTQRAADYIRENCGNTPICFSDYHEALNKSLVDAVYVASSWETHIEISIAAMRAGIPVGCEVGKAYTVRECFDLVKAYEETKTPFMFLENCCFGREELLATAAVRSGKLGAIVHCSGAYGHDLRGAVSKGNLNRHYRLRNYINCNCDNYPTHALGPIARIWSESLTI